MRGEPSLTLEGALKILGAQETEPLGRLNRLLGGVILTSGLVAGVATIGPAAMAPAAALAPVWGWMDQKNEAMQLLGRLTRGLTNQFREVPTLERRELIGAAHTVIVAGAFFDGLRTWMGKNDYEKLKLSLHEQLSLMKVQNAEQSSELLRNLYELEVPAPSPAQGFEENTEAVERWMTKLASRTESFLGGLTDWSDYDSLEQEVVPLAVSRYRENYVDLAKSIPEFFIWATLGEHAATRLEIAERRSEVATALAVQHDDLRRIEALLELTTGRDSSPSRAQSILSRSNRARLDQPIIRREEAASLGAVRLPIVGSAFVTPTYRVTRQDSRARVTDEHWWRTLDEHDDLDLWLSGFALCIDSTRVPLLLLGHPGAGKSMLMKILAARLPEKDYTVVLVPLRAVGANAPILDQIQQALDQSTNRRVIWSQLSDQSNDTVRVVILDGLDELLQASSSDRSGFLQEVMEFQRIEAEQERPVIVIVTSRTVVADRVDIPSDSTVLKLEDFRAAEIDRWLQVWNATNADAISAGVVRGLSTEAAMSQPDLAGQPLLLLMLALYSSDPQSVPLASGVSITTLYQRIIEEFARREVMKTPGVHARDEVDQRVEATVGRLCVAALAMFNRGTQSVTEPELTADLIAIGDAALAESREDSGQRLLGEFFFMHTAEATLLGAGSTESESKDVAANRRARRSYEFLHATFGEYLVSYRLLDELRDMADRAYTGRRPRDPDDELLFALLSHQPLAVRRSILTFLAELFVSLEEEEREGILRVLSFLSQNHRRRVGGDRFATYQPIPVDRLRQLAAYSANLVLLRVALAPGHERVPFSALISEGGSDAKEWRSALSLWRAGLEADGWHSMISALSPTGGGVSLAEADDSLDVTSANADYLHARLAGDFEAQARLRYGIALNDEVLINDGSDPTRTLLSVVYSDMVGLTTSSRVDQSEPPDPDTLSGTGMVRPQVPADIRGDQVVDVVAALERLLLTRQASDALAREHIATICSLVRLTEVNPLILFLNVCRFPSLLEHVTELREPSLYDEPDLAILMAACIPPVRREQMQEGSADDGGVDHFGVLLAKLSELSPHWANYVKDLPEEVRAMLVRLVFNLRDDRWDDAAGALRMRSRVRRWQSHRTGLRASEI